MPAKSNTGATAITVTPAVPPLGKRGHAGAIHSHETNTVTSLRHLPAVAAGVGAHKPTGPAHQHDLHVGRPNHNQPGQNPATNHNHNQQGTDSNHNHGSNHANHSHSHGGFGSARNSSWWSLTLGSPYSRSRCSHGGPRFPVGGFGSGFGGGYGSSFCNVGTGLALGCGPLLLQDDFVMASTPVTVTSQSPIVTSVPAPAITANLTAEEFNSLKFVDQRKLLVQNANQLRDELLAAENGESWVRYLQLSAVASVVGEGDEPPNAETRQQISGIADLFDETVRNPTFQDVTQSQSFRTLHLSLREFSTEPVVHLRRLLTTSAQELSQKLNDWENGDRWRTYLQLDSLLSLDDSLVDADQRLAELDVLQAKLERVQTGVAFETVRSEEAFQHTRLALQWYVGELRRVLSGNIPPELP